MGYTNFFKRPTTLNKKKFEAFVEEVKTLHKNLPKHSESAGGHYAEEKLIICGGNGEGEPTFNNDLISFNGSNENDMSHETMFIERVYEPQDWQTPEKGKYFEFCKTARKPYDLLVCACLISFKKHFGKQVGVSSTGDMEDWKPAIDLYEKVTGNKVPEILLED